MDTIINKEIKSQPYQESMIDTLPTDRFVYLLIDGAQTKALPLIYTQNQQPEFEVLYHNTPYQEMLDISPVIVRLDNNSQLQKRYQQWQPYAVAFTTTVDLKTTANHLKSLILCKMPNTQPAFFRFYAHNWLYPLLTGQDESTLYSFTGPIDNWYIPVPDKQWQNITIIKQGDCKEAKDEAWFTLTEELQAKLADYSFQRYIDELTIEFTYAPLNTEEGQAIREQVLIRVNTGKSFGLELRSHLAKYIQLAFDYPKIIDDQQATKILAKEYEMPRIRLDQLECYLQKSSQNSTNEQTVSISNQSEQQGIVQ